MVNSQLQRIGVLEQPPSVPAAVNVAVTRFAADTGGGSQDITIAGFGTPKAALFILSYGTADGTPIGHEIYSIGATDGTRQWSVSAKAENGVGSSDNHEAATTAKVITIRAISSAVDADAEFSAWITDGVRINWGATNPPDNANLITCVLFGGDDLEAYAEGNTLAATGSAITVTPGFEANAFITAFGRNFNTGANSFFRLSPGFASWDGATLRQCSVRSNASHSQATSNANTTVSDDELSGTAGANGVELQNIDSTSFEFLSSGQDFSSSGMGVLALGLSNGAEAWAGVLDLPTSTGDWTVADPGIQPTVGFLAPTMVTTLSTQENGGACGYSVFTADAEFCCSWSDENGATTMNTESVSDDAAMYLNADDGTSAFRGTFSSFNSDGFTLNMTAADGTIRKCPALMISV